MNPRLLQILITILALGILGFGGYQTFKLLYKPAPKPKTITVVDYLNNPNVQLRLTLIGQVTAPEKHVQQAYTISNSNRDLAITKNYTGTPAFTRSLDFNQAAFSDFAQAMQSAGFTTKNTTPSDDTVVGACPTGTRSVYELIVDGNDVFKAWSSTCGDGNFKGEPGLIRQLFQAQFPDLYKLPPDLQV